VAINP
jgi:hypothetical protein